MKLKSFLKQYRKYGLEKLLGSGTNPNSSFENKPWPKRPGIKRRIYTIKEGEK